MADDDVTLGELSRGLHGLESRLDAQFHLVNRRLDNLQFVPRGEFEIQMQAHGEDIKELKESRQWFQRILVGSFLFPVFVAVIAVLVGLAVAP